MANEHPFAQYVRILGKGPTLSRPLSREETRTAVAMILSGDVEPVQLGAFLCLLRVKTETAEELAGFVEAARATLVVPSGPPAVDIDWGTYAGKSRRLPWFLLSALLLSTGGLRVFMHGAEGHTPGRLYASEVFRMLGVPVANSLDEAARQLGSGNFAYLTLERMSPELHRLMELKPLLGLRSPVHTVGRMLNPFKAAHEVIGVAHPHYRPVHQEAGQLLGQPHLVVFKGEGGEAERRPEKPCLSFVLHGDAMRQEEWPALPASPPPHWDDIADPARLRQVWSGAVADDYAVAVIASTAAIPLKLAGRAHGFDEALALARRLWEGRPRERLAGAG